jgi:hypothetical protein
MTRYLLLLALCATHAGAAESGRVVVKPEDTGTALVNPGMGWVLEYYDDALHSAERGPSDTLDDFPALSAVYFRVPWAWLEPEEGRFTWSALDLPAQRWIARGKQVAFAVTSSDPGLPSAVPAWAQRANIKGFKILPAPPGSSTAAGRWEPAFDDGTLIAKLDRFLDAVAQRYAGNRDVAFVRAGTFGLAGTGAALSSDAPQHAAAAAQTHIDLHTKHFPGTPVIVDGRVFDCPGGEAMLAELASKGLGLHLATARSRTPPPRFWDRNPVVLGTNSDEWNGGRDFVEALEQHHASYISAGWWIRDAVRESRSVIDRINTRLGYRLQLLEASWPAEAAVGSEFAMNCKWRNAGVAPCLPGGYPALTLKDAKGGLAAVIVDGGFNVLSLPAGKPGLAEVRTEQSSFTVPIIVKPGAYNVFLSVGTSTGTPRIALPLPGEDGQRRYRLGSMTITSK